MVDTTEKALRMAQWHALLNRPPTDENWVVWYRELQHALSDMLGDGLIDPGEAYDLRELADAAFSRYANNPVAGDA